MKERADARTKSGSNAIMSSGIRRVETHVSRAFVSGPIDLASAQPAELAERLDQDGIVCLPNIIDDAMLAQCQAFVDQQVEEHGAEYFSLINVDRMPGSPFGLLARDNNFKSLLHELCAHAAGRSIAEGSEIYNVLRVVIGKTGVRKAYQFHYDATAITALMPLYIPEGAEGTAGDLIVFPNLRRVRRFVPVNLVEKIAVQNRWASKILRTKRARAWLGAKRVKLRPGNLYLFWGYRTLHGNEPCSTDALRATTIFHLGDPHGNNVASNAVLAIRRMLEARALRADGRS